jgi:hypothetical protein
MENVVNKKLTIEESLKYFNKDIENKISIVYSMISFLENHIENNLCDDYTEKLRLLLNDEKDELKQLKIKYPEFFI